MSHLCWPAGTQFRFLELAPDERLCTYCGGRRHVRDHKHRYLHTLEGPLHLVSKVTCCADRSCAGHADREVSASEMSIAARYWSVGWDLFAWMGQRRFARHWSVPQIREDLRDRFGIGVSTDLIEDYVARYEVMVAAREGDVERLATEYRNIDDLMLSIDGLQPEKGHETLYVVRELRAARVWFAEPLLSSAAAEVRRLFERAQTIASRVGKPVRCWVSDKQEAFVSGVQAVFPGVPHRYCGNHFLRDAAKPTLEADSHAKVQMRRRVRGLRDIERRMLTQSGEDERAARSETAAGAEQPPRAAPANEAPLPTQAPPVAEPRSEPPPAVHTPPPADAGPAVVLDYCAAVRGILNDDQGGPLRPPGIRMAEALGEVRDSLGRVLEEKKGGLVSGP